MSLQGTYTTKGLALAAKIAAGTRLTVTRVMAGGGTTAAGALALAEEKQTLTVGTAEAGGQTAALPVTLAEVQTGASYTLTELGVYASDPDEGEILYQVFRLDESRSITAGGGNVYRFYLKETVGAGGMTVVCSPAGLLTDEDLAPTRDKVLAKTLPIKQISLTAAQLQGFLDGLPRLLTDVYYITFTGELTERLTLSGFYGGGGINILGTAQGESKLSGGVTCHGCFAGITFRKCTISVSSGECALTSKYASIVDIDECAVSGGSQGCLSLSYDGVINVRNGCSFSGGAYVVVLSISGTAVFHVAEGDSYTCPGGIWIWHGGCVVLNESASNTLGGSYNSKDGGGYIISAAGTLI